MTNTLNKPLLELINIKKDYYTKNKETNAIENISLKINKNEFITIVGPSGCGKSTLLNIIANLEQVTKGNIIKNNNLKIAYMFQTDCLFDHLTILDNCLLSSKINKIDNKEYVKYLLKKYGLEEYINAYPKNLSGGMRQRVALIRTLASTPDLILLDEPFSALDYQTRLSVSKDVYEIIKNEHKTVIMITHDIAEAISLSDKVIILTKQPSIIKKILPLKFSNNLSPIEKRSAPEFNKYYEEIWKDIDKNV